MVTSFPEDTKMCLKQWRRLETFTEISVFIDFIVTNKSAYNQPLTTGVLPFKTAVNTTKT